MIRFRAIILASTAMLAGPALAQIAAPTAVTGPTATVDTGAQQDEIIVTGTVRPERKIDTSISISSVNAETIGQIQPESAADLIRYIPGIRSEASGGEGNANISVRGLPVASGGAKFIQFQEDGIPVLLFGDISFGTADTFVKADNNIARVEAVRGGSASTAADNAPGAILNFITKDGTVEGGSVGIVRGVDFDRTRLDFDYGAHLGDDWKFHVGGFYHYGDGVKETQLVTENGGQIKANVIRSFANGFVRFDVKFLDDRSPVYLPVPVAIDRSGSDATYSSITGFNLKSGALQSPFLNSLLSLDQNGNRVTDHADEGYRTVTKAFGGEASFDLGSGFRVDDVFAEGSAPGSRQWSGSTVVSADHTQLTLYFTAAGRRGETCLGFEQRLFVASASLIDIGRPVIGGWTTPVEIVGAGGWYMQDMNGGGAIGTIKAFRDPYFFRDPVDGADYLLFTASLAASTSPWNGCVGLAARDNAGWRLAPPLITAAGVNNELERPHVVIHGGRYYCFWSTQAKVFAADGPGGPSGLYGMVADRFAGPWRPLNGSGLVIANPAAAPNQAYSWLVLHDLRVLSFADLVGLSAAPSDPAVARRHFGGTPAPELRLRLDVDCAELA